MISDRGPQFASKVMKGIYAKLGITSALSTAYHPQTDGETERFNQELEQFLRIFCNYRQDDWVKWLPYAEFCHNSRTHSATGKSPFELLHGFLPQLFPTVNPISQVPSVEEQLQNLEAIHKEVQASLDMAAESMKRSHGDHIKEGKEFKVGDKVLLDGKNLKTNRPKAKLSDRRHGPFIITEKIGKVNYRLQLPKTWKIHPVFHASLLMPFRETRAHGPNFPGPPPELLPDDEEYDVEAILNSRPTRNKRGVEYLVKWLDYSDAENSWEPASGLHGVQQLIDEFHAKNPSAYKSPPLRRPGSAVQSLDIPWKLIWHVTSVLQAQAPPEEGVMSRTASILLPPPSFPHQQTSSKPDCRLTQTKPP